ncbi:hypothetical protein [Natronococcus sp.]|uniref:hypothetical protein n=1 Tax=Natronococcus sp. TaxID=35747 RepID=UPI0025D0F8AC|nr:hypothetical protein [Natronococcus sp.]
MSVLRQPGVLGRTRRRHVLGAIAALSAGAVETVSVSVWFVLAVGSRTTPTALLGVAVLVGGTLLRTRLVAAVVGTRRVRHGPRWIGLSLAVAAAWICWLLLAEALDPPSGPIVATVLLGGVLSAQFALEQAACQSRSADADRLAAVVPGLLLALGGGLLLWTAWVPGWTISTPALPLGVATVVVRIEPLQLGPLGFGVLAVFAHRRRFQRLLEP